MQHSFTRDRFTWMAYLVLALYGYFLNVIGPITPFLKDELGLSYTVSSLHYTAFAIGIILVGLGGDVAIQRFGRWRSLWIGAGGLSLGALLLVTGRSPWITITAAFLMGLVGSLILAIIPSALSDRHGEQRAIALTEANMIASVAATIAPLLVGFFARTIFGWRVALLGMALMPLLMYVIFRGTSLHETKQASPDQPDEAKKPLPGRFWALWWALVLGVAVEFCMISWSADYLEKALGMLKADAAQSVSLFLGAMIVGRLVISRLTQRVSTLNLVSTSILVAGGGFLLFWLGGSVATGLVGLFLTGLGVAGLYPLILALAIGAAGSQTVQAGSRATLASGTAILTLPLVLGRLADAFSIQQAYGVVGLLLVGAFVIIRAARRPQDPSDTSPVHSRANS
jgi:fucose permease